MSAVTTEVGVCSRALLLIGLSPIAAFDEGSDKAGVCDGLYATIIEALLRSYPWRFAMGKSQLARLSGTPINEWQYAFQLPVDRMGEPRAVFSTNAVGAQPIADFEIFTDKLLTNAESIWIDYPFKPEVSKWPPHFLQLAIYALAAHFADALTEEGSKAQFWWNVAYGSPAEGGAGGYLRTAKSIDANSNPPEVIQDYTLIDVRMG